MVEIDYIKGPVLEKRDNKKRGKGGRFKRVEPDLEQVEQLGSLLCSEKEMAEFFGLTQQAMNDIKRRTNFKEAFQKGRNKTMNALRYALLTKGVKMMNPEILTLLAKKHLGYNTVDKNNADITNNYISIIGDRESFEKRIIGRLSSVTDSGTIDADFEEVDE